MTGDGEDREPDAVDLENDVIDAITRRFGAVEGIFTPSWPRFIGGGEASVAACPQPDGGTIYVTTDASTAGKQQHGTFGPFELAFAHRDPGERFGAGLISRLAVYADAELVEPGHTMDLPRNVSPRRTRLRGLLFSDFGRLDDPLGTGVLLVIGLTHDEVDRARFGDAAEIDTLVRSAGDHPYTDWRRRSLLGRPR